MAFPSENINAVPKQELKVQCSVYVFKHLHCISQHKYFFMMIMNVRMLVLCDWRGGGLRECGSSESFRSQISENAWAEGASEG